MSIANTLRQWRDWFPVPKINGEVDPIRWILLEGNRMAVTGALISGVFVSLVALGMVWTLQMQRILTETPAIQTILNTLLSGIILLVSVVVSINSIVLSHDITSVHTQEDRLEAALEFRKEIGRLTEGNQRPSDPASFLALMGDAIEKHAAALEEATEGLDREFTTEVEDYVREVRAAVSWSESNGPEPAAGADFGILWNGLETDPGEHLDRSRSIKLTYNSVLSEETEECLDDLTRSLRLFAIGKEYFKTLYYNQEVSELSRTLLFVSLPAILINAAAILAINARILPNFWVFGVPSLLLFVAGVFTVSLIPYIVLTAYTLRLATVAGVATSAGPFSLGG
ncbi:hypothetical protein BRD08_02075 [Halobacteriales archaeon SW_10_66_29]|nr:MAG: hypothetical protein BRD08_02075 [Halobacteriales archaeon SW_10_66_29]